MADRHIEMTWVCAACATRNLGRYTACQRCGKAKTTEVYEMPADAAHAASVTDPELLRLATGGANWVCRYCGSDQRRADGECARCGGERTAREREERAQQAAHGAPHATGHEGPRGAGLWALRLIPIAAIVVLVLIVGAMLFAAKRASPPPTIEPAAQVAAPAEVVGPVPGSVVSMKWEQRLVIERYQLLPGEGFAEQRPADALEVKAAGTHVHHVDQVPDGTREETYTEEVPDGYREETYTETVPDGTRTESYTEQAQCGQDCRSTPPSCRQVCTSSKNGFANCKDVCSGGGQTCSPKYCSQSRTRQVPQTKTVTRTRQVPKTKTVTRTRQVPKTRPVERMAPWFTWRAWSWKQDRVLRREGDTAPLAWPAASEGKPSAPLAKGEQERSSQKGDYTLTVADSAGKPYQFHPTDGALLDSLHNGDPVIIHLAAGGIVESVEAAGK
jgi:hypothetical protein